MGTQKNRLNETVLLSTKNICLKLWVRKYLQFNAEMFCYLNLCSTTMTVCSAVAQTGDQRVAISRLTAGRVTELILPQLKFPHENEIILSRRGV